MNNSPSIPFNLRRLGMIILSTLFVIGFLIWLLLPVVTKTLLNNYFQQQNAQLIINELDINPFQGSILAKNVEAYSINGESKEKVLSLESFKIDLSYAALLNQTIYVNTLRLNGLEAPLVQSKDAWHVAGLTFPIPPANNKDQDQADSVIDSSAEQETVSDWKIDVPKIQISNTRLSLERFNQTTPASPFKDTLTINKITVSDIEGQANVWNAKADIDLDINQSIVRLQSSFTYNPEKVSAVIALDELTFDSTQFSHYFIDNEPTPQIMISLSGDMEVEQDLTTSKPNLSLSSHAFSMLLDDINIRTPDLSFSSDKIHLETLNLDFNLSNGEHFSIQTEASLEADASKLTMMTKANDPNLENDTNISSNSNLSNKTNAPKIDVFLEKLSTNTKLTVSQNDKELNLLNPSSNVELLGLSGQLDDIKITNELSHLLLTDLALKQDSNSNINVDGSLSFNSKQLDLDSTLNSLNAHYQSIQFASQVALNKTLEKLNVNTLNTSLVTNTLGFTQGPMTLTNEATDLSLPTLNLEVFLNETASLSVDLETQLSSQNTYFKNADDFAQYKEVFFSGSLALAQKEQLISVDGKALKFEAHDLAADQVGYKLDSKLIQFSLPNILLQQTSEQDIELTADPKIDLEAINVFDADNDQLLGLGSLSSSPVHIEKTPSSMTLKMDDITLANAIISKPNPDHGETQHLAKFSKLHANALDISDTKATIQSVILTDLQSNLLFDEKRELRNLVFAKADPELEEISANTTNATSAKTATEANESHSAPQNTSAEEAIPAATYHVQLGEFKINGDSNIHINDKGISPSLNQTIYIDDFQITQVDTSNPEQATHILLDARNGKYATIHLESDIIPFNDKLTMQTLVSTREIELTPFSPYISDILGYTIESGQLDADIKLDADQGQLTGDSTLLLRRFDLGGKNDQPSSNSPSVIPLNLAIGALKDAQNNISLSMPMSGDIDNPSFQWQNFLIIPIRKALYSASSSYLMQTFVPYANIISVAQIASEQIFKLRMKPLVYTAEDIDLADDQVEFVNQLTALLKDRNDTQLKMCSIAVPADLGIDNVAELTKEQIQSLKSLAQLRAENLKDRLISSGEISSARLLLCSSAIDDKAEASPRIEFEF
ncbi:DUF748 domain-containing protein [Marinomonas sp. 15G1-11]|uniref:DUF748 domain-containing protein n=1 Tax=Marinomonas phaeophyticola TaxID=3004091 RepID=A0ABT4JQG6_9GAMM|nr:DUF748 domain-containing protein [Marinomonas sp. 15G1-11]MCZ2720627.1 DUF748 domain-containing protein [Marinomonas sp. 15G1-11]